MKILYRPAKPSDVPFIFDSWLRSWRDLPWSGTIPNNLYADTQRSCIEQLLARGARIEVAHPEGRDDHILGWACTEVTRDGFAVLHYLYVKDPYITLSIDDQLVARAEGKTPGFYTHRNPRFLSVIPGWTHAPEIARRKA